MMENCRGYVQRRAFGVVKKKKTKVNLLAVDNFFIEKNNVCDIDFEKRSLDKKEVYLSYFEKIAHMQVV